jgi:hypothetical protein
LIWRCWHAGTLSLSPGTKQVSFEVLSEMLKKFLQSKIEKVVTSGKGTEVEIANALTNFDDACRVLPKLEQGLDINVVRKPSFSLRVHLILFCPLC